MKRNIFESYIDKVCSMQGITREQLFSKHSGRRMANARQFLYWLCSMRGMDGLEIKEYSDQYIDLSHTTILHGIRIMRTRSLDDDDLVKIERSIRESVTI
jgi:chromosomal replication initiation ATPase DnaA